MMMNDTKVTALMKQMPGHFADEVLEYRAAKGIGTAVTSQFSAPRILRILLPAAAAAAAAGFACILIPRRPNDPVQMNSHEPEVTEIIAAATTETTETTTVSAETHTTAHTAQTKQTSSAARTTALSTTASAQTTAGTVQTRSANAGGYTAGTQAQSAAPVQTTTAEPDVYDPHDILKQYALGDVDMDGRVDASDAQIVMSDVCRMLTGEKSELTPEQTILADVIDGDRPIDPDNLWNLEYIRRRELYLSDSPITADDASMILEHYVKLVGLSSAIPLEDLNLYPKEELGECFPAAFITNVDLLHEYGDVRYQVTLDPDDPSEFIEIPLYGTVPVTVNNGEPLRLTSYQIASTDTHPNSPTVMLQYSGDQTSVTIRYYGEFRSRRYISGQFEYPSGSYRDYLSIDGAIAYYGDCRTNPNLPPRQKFTVLEFAEKDGSIHQYQRYRIEVNNADYDTARAFIDLFFEQSELCYEP